MKVKVRVQPCTVYYVTGDDAYDCRKAADGPPVNYAPCFVTEDLGANGLTWETIEEFEGDRQECFGDILPRVDEPVAKKPRLDTCGICGVTSHDAPGENWLAPDQCDLVDGPICQECCGLYVIEAPDSEGEGDDFPADFTINEAGRQRLGIAVDTPAQ